MRQILSAVSYCHERHIVHRDLKPENLLLLSKASDALLKVIDFGTSSRITKQHHFRTVTGTIYYMAPEVLDGPYTEKCDIWSCGVIMYLLMSKSYTGGSPPFHGITETDIKWRIKQGRVDFSGEIWTTVSQEAKEFLMQMLTGNPDARPTAKTLLAHPWLTSPPCSLTRKPTILRNLTHFRTCCKFRQAVLQYIAWQFAPTEESDALQRLFIELDTDKDGKISKIDLETNFKEYLPENVDNICTESIEFHEFLSATLNWKRLLTREVLEKTFKAFDKDGNGVIQVEELRFMLQGDQEVENEVWTDVLQEVDRDGDGAVIRT